MTRLYRIICLKRSCFADHITFEYTKEFFDASWITYWRPNAEGYTNSRDEAGLYTGLELEDINGVHCDWLLDPVERIYDE